MLKNELNKFEVVESRCGGGDLEYVLITDTKEHREQLNYLLCAINTWAYVPERFSPSMYEFLSETNVSFVDMKFQSEKSSEGYGEEILHSVFLVYEEPEIGQ